MFIFLSGFIFSQNIFFRPSKDICSVKLKEMFSRFTRQPF